MVVYERRQGCPVLRCPGEGRTSHGSSRGARLTTTSSSQSSRRSGGGPHPVVVTSDRELRKRCLAQGGSWLSEDLASVLVSMTVGRRAKAE